jgi:hypothetical protein
MPDFHLSEIRSLLIRVNNTAGITREGDSFRDIHEQDRQREEWAAWYATVCTAGEDLRTVLRQ